MRTRQRVSAAAGRYAAWGILLCASPLVAQEPPVPTWALSVGGGIVSRTEHGSSFGANARVARSFQAAAGLYLEPGVAWQGYARSDQTYDVCPPGGCPPVRRDGISLLGAELGARYSKLGRGSSVQPVASLGFYRSSSLDISLARFGASAGLLIPFSSSGSGPGIEVRYFRMFGDPRFKSLVPLSLRWSF
jgi:hypothetical protein